MKKLILAIAFFFTGASQAATITNGSFEAGLTGWSEAGNAVLSIANVTDGSFSALLDPDNGFASAGAIEAALGVPAGYLSSLAPGLSANSGVALYQSVGNVKAGEFISFDYTFNEFDGGSFNDVAVALLDGDTGSLVDSVLGTANTGNSSGSGILMSDGIKNAVLAFVAFDSGDTLFSPQLWIDNVDATIPVPATLFLLGIGLLALGLVKRKKA